MTATSKILVVSLSNIGDAVLTTPVLEALHSAYPEDLIDIVADPRSSEIFTRFPYLGRIVHKYKRRGIRGLVRMLRDLRVDHYRLIVDLRTDFIPYLLRADQRLVKWRARSLDLDLYPHAVERHFAVVASWLGTTTPPSTCVYLDGPLRTKAAAHLRALPRGRWLALAPGANYPGKLWPWASYSRLVGLLAHDFAGVVLLGAPADGALTGAIALDVALPCVDLSGRTSLLEAAAVIEQCACLVGNDSGLGHLASAVATASLTVFGIGDPSRYRPWGPLATMMVAPERDLSKIEPMAVAEHLRAHLADLKIL